jgi:hypothetical protein
VAQLCPWALGSFYFASYDSQGYGGDILTPPPPRTGGPGLRLYIPQSTGWSFPNSKSKVEVTPRPTVSQLVTSQTFLSVHNLDKQQPVYNTSGRNEFRICTIMLSNVHILVCISDSLIIGKFGTLLYFVKKKVEVTWRPTVSQSVCPGVGHPWPHFTFSFLCRKIALLFVLGRPLWREDGCVICSAICQWSELRRIHNHTWLSHLRLLGSPSVASYDPQGLQLKYSYPPPHGEFSTWSWSHVTTDGQSVITYWCRAHFGTCDQKLIL